MKRVRELGPGGVQGYLKRLVLDEGGDYYHFTSPGRNGVPDLIVLWESGAPHFIETKAPNGVLSGPQKREHQRLRARGQKVFVLWTKVQVDRYIDTGRLCYDGMTEHV